MKMSNKSASLRKWITEQTGVAGNQLRLEPLTGDASFRKYFRLSIDSKSYVAVHAPPLIEDNFSFLKIQKLLEENNIRVPEIRADNLDFGYLLLEDLGDTHLYDCLSDQKYFDMALDLLLELALVDISDGDLPSYSSAILESELNIFPEWFLVEQLGLNLGVGERDLIEEMFRCLIENAQEQPKIFVHRDFHSRNIMCLNDSGSAVIDFQDAVIGPITYDFVSLTKDCYIRRSPMEVKKYALQFREKLIKKKLLPESSTDLEFLQWVDFMGLQRHLKVLGIFSRLHLRDGKPSYLEHLPLVIDYVVETIFRYKGSEPLISEFNNWFEDSVLPAISTQPWMQSN